MTSLSMRVFRKRTRDRGREADRVWREKFVPGLPSIQIQEIDAAFRAVERRILGASVTMKVPATTSVPTMQFRSLERYT